MSSKKEEFLDDIIGFSGLAIALVVFVWIIAYGFHKFPVETLMVWWAIPWIFTVLVLALFSGFIAFALWFGMGKQLCDDLSG